MFLIVAVSVILPALFCACSAAETAFTVRNTISGILYQGHTLVFQQEILDEGNNFNTDTGLFTAPKGGIYVFYFGALNYQNGVFWLDLYQNDNYKASIYAPAGGSSSSGHTVVLRLVRNDKVYIKARVHSYITGTQGSQTETHTLFTGYYLRG